MRLETVTRAPDRESLRALAERSAGAGVVLSVYVDLDPSRFSTPPARETQLTSLLNEAETAAESLSHDDRTSARAAVARVREYVERLLPAEGAGALAVFCSATADLFEVLKLPRSVPGAVFLERRPVLGPVADFVATPSWCVLLVNRSSARIFGGDEYRLEEIEDFHDEVHRQHSQGGWSQARYERSVEQDVQNHLAHTVEVLTNAWDRRTFDHLVVGALSELMPAQRDANRL